MVNLRKRISVRLVNNGKDFLKHTSRPTHITHKIFGQNYAATQEIKPVLTLNKPISVGFTVLEITEWLIIKNTLMLNCYLLTQTVLLTA